MGYSYKSYSDTKEVFKKFVNAAEGQAVYGISRSHIMEMAKKAEQVVPEIIDSVEGLNAKMAAMREAQKVFATYTQEQVDKIFFAAASAANKMRIPLAKMAVEETGMGIVEDKVIKNN